MFGHCVSYMLMLGHKNMQAYFCDTRYRMFHVKHFKFVYYVSNDIKSPYHIPTLNCFHFC
jgi:hypothetical protein